MKKFVKSEIETIEKMTTVEIPAIVNNQAGVNPKDYDQKRIELNMHLIQALCGAEIVDPKKSGGEYRMKFCHTLPDKGEVAKIAAIVDKFIREVENPYFQALAANAQPQAGGDDDMAIPATGNVQVNGAIPAIEKVNNKKLKNYIFGYGGNAAMVNIALTSMDCITIAAFGEEARKSANRKMMFIIGGVAVVLAGAGVAAVMINNKRKEEAAEEVQEEITIETQETDIDLDGAPTVELDDAPAVDLD